LFNLVCWQRSAKQKTLHLAATLSFDGFELLFGLHTLCRRRNPEAMRQRRKDPYDIEGARTLGNIPDEGPVDLDLVER
jgi:hypothetical protein